MIHTYPIIKENQVEKYNLAKIKRVKTNSVLEIIYS